jgi:hypothetical protein
MRELREFVWTNKSASSRNEFTFTNLGSKKIKIGACLPK